MMRPADTRATRPVMFASRNRIKLEEAHAFFKNVKPLDVTLLEVQAVDPEVVVAHKLEQVAALDLDVPVLVEDTGLAFAAWGGLPGALVAWFVEALGPEGFRQLIAEQADQRATATSVLGLLYRGERKVWRGSLDGVLVPARGDLGGWTPVFQVAGTNRTLAEMTLAERLQLTMRREPFQRAAQWLG